jgi:hypothetical protein
MTRKSKKNNLSFIESWDRLDTRLTNLDNGFTKLILSLIVFAYILEYLFLSWINIPIILPLNLLEVLGLIVLYVILVALPFIWLYWIIKED